MAGVMVPLVLLPRYTCYSGADIFTTNPFDVSAYANVVLNMWRSAMFGTTPLFKVTFQESTDLVTWFTMGGTTVDYELDPDVEEQFTAAVTKRWFRLKVQLTGATPVATCWAVGSLEQLPT
jgi:hypothetical protein